MSRRAAAVVRGWTSVIAACAVALALVLVPTVSGPASAAPEPGRGYLHWVGAIGDIGAPPASLLDRPLNDVELGLWFGIAVLPGGEVQVWGEDSQLSTPPGLASGTRGIAAGQCHGLAIDASGQVRTIDPVAPGSDCPAEVGQRTVPAALTGKVATQIAAGGVVSAAWTTDGTLTLWGDTTDVQDVPAGVRSASGLTSLDAVTYGFLTGEAMAAVTASGDLYAWGADANGRVSQAPNGPTPGVTYVDAKIGIGFTLGLTSTGDVHVFSTAASALAVPQEVRDRRIVAIGAGDATLWAVDEDGTVFTWGEILELDMDFPVTKVTGGSLTRAALYSPGSVDAQPRDGIPADGTSASTVTVTARDLAGDVVAGAQVEIWRDGTPTGITGVTGTDGRFTYLLTSSSAGAYEMSAVVDGVLTNAVQVEFDPLVDPVVNLANSTIAATSPVVADGTDSSTITVTTRDQDDEPMTVGGSTVAVAVRPGTGLLTAADITISSVTDVGDGTYVVEATSTTAGTARFGFSIDGTSNTTSTADVSFTAGPVDTGSSTIVAAPTSITADGTSTSTITVNLADADDNPVAGQPVTITTTAGTIGATADDGDGTYSATLTSPTAAGTATVGFTLDGTTAAQTTTVAFTAGAVAPGASTISADPTSITADGASTSTITVSLTDANTNPVAGRTVNVTTTGGAISATTDNGDGTYTATLTSPTAAGTATASFTVDGAAATQTATVTFTVGTVAPGASTITATPSSITADGTSTATVEVSLFDGNSNPAPGEDVAVTTTAGTISGTTDNGDGTYTATLTSATTAGTATVGFTLDGTTAAPETTVAFTAGAVAPGASTINADPTSITADGTSTSTITVSLTDTNSNPVAGQAVVITTSAGTIGTTTDHGDGTYTAILTSATTAGTATIGATLNGTALDLTTEVLFTPVDTTPTDPPTDPTNPTEPTDPTDPPSTTPPTGTTPPTEAPTHTDPPTSAVTPTNPATTAPSTSAGTSTSTGGTPSDLARTGGNGLGAAAALAVATLFSGLALVARHRRTTTTTR